MENGSHYFAGFQPSNHTTCNCLFQVDMFVYFKYTIDIQSTIDRQGDLRVGDDAFDFPYDRC